jgi:osmotically-inducible protein OsmY
VLIGLLAFAKVTAVHDMGNDIQVKVPGRLARSDTAIAQIVRRMLVGDERVPDTYIETTVADGWVTLQGPKDHPCIASIGSTLPNTFLGCACLG